MHLPEQYLAAEALEQYLGDPSDTENLFSFKRAVELDEREEYPEEACRLLSEWNLHGYYIPVTRGGKLRSFEEVFSLVRAVARRDLTVAMAHAKTYLGATPVWVAGNDKQQQRLAKVIKNQGAVSLALTERAHGSDLLSTGLRATRCAHGYLFSGEKWLISNATRGVALSIFARTETGGGPRGFSLFLVEKQSLEKSSYSYLPKIKTHGIRGADISGIRFKDCLVSADSLIEPIGSGLEIILKSLQVTRTVIPCLSLGAGDTALRATLSFALGRRLYGDSVFAIPHAQSLLVDAFLDLLICDCVALAACRSLHVSTDQLSVWSAVVKYFVPITIESMIRGLAVVLGARHYLREEYQWGAFQKIMRDVALVSLFDGSTAINLHALGSQLGQLASHRAKPGSAPNRQLWTRLENVFSLRTPISDFDPKQLELFNRGHNDVLQSLEIALCHLHRLKAEPTVNSEILRTIITLTGSVAEELDALERNLTNLAAAYGPAFSKSPELFQAAKKYCVLHTAAACLHMWIHNRQSLGEFFARGEWLALSLDRLLMNFQDSRCPSAHAYAASVARELVKLYEEHRLFSIVPFRLARSQSTYQRSEKHEIPEYPGQQTADLLN